MKKFLICGSRTSQPHFTSIIEDILKTYNPKEDLLICGGAPGVDTLAKKLAKQKGFEVKVLRADWGRYGDDAGPIRNSAMINLKPDKVYCLPYPNIKKSIGTRDTYNKAVAANIPVVVL
jgi:hypothetical protein